MYVVVDSLFYLLLFVGFLCFGLCFVMHYLVSFIVLQLNVFLMSCE